MKNRWSKLNWLTCVKDSSNEHFRNFNAILFFLCLLKYAGKNSFSILNEYSFSKAQFCKIQYACLTLFPFHSKWRWNYVMHLWLILYYQKEKCWLSFSNKPIIVPSLNNENSTLQKKLLRLSSNNEYKWKCDVIYHWNYRNRQKVSI